MNQPLQSTPHKQYLGDAVYADFDGFFIVLTTENGVSATNTIMLEPGVAKKLGEYLKKFL